MDDAEPESSGGVSWDRAAGVVLSGSFRRDPDGLRRTFEELRDIGCRVLSPGNVRIQSEENGFVFMQGEIGQRPEAIEHRHLDAIQAAEFVWLHAPDGYVGLSSALEVGFASAVGVPIFASAVPSDATIRAFVRSVPSPEHALESVRGGIGQAPRSMRAFQHYYRRIAAARGFEKETAEQSLLLMIEEVGELARAVRKRAHLARHHAYQSSEGLELADVFIYVAHLANVLHLDLETVVRQKEVINHERFSRRKAE
jgi:NTP pyrophosphatase (non-canonical NTP hydrolase)